MNIEDYPFAGWMEESLKSVTELNPDTIGIVARSDAKKVVFTGYFNASAEDKAVLAHHIYTDAVMEIVTSNIDVIRDALEEEEYEEPDDADLEMGFDPYAGCYTDDC